MERNKFLTICREICRRRQSFHGRRSFQVGKERQKKINRILGKLKEEKIIRDFIEMEDLSFQDVVEGIDFKVVYIDGVYKTCSLSVTGEKWLEEHKLKHPEIPVICVSANEASASLKNKIIETIEQQKALKKI